MVKSKNDVAFNIVVYAIMIIVLLVCLIPILYVISMSFTPYAELVKRGGFVLIPSKFTLTAYHEMLKDGSLLNGLWVTVRLTVIGTICNLFFTLLMAYPLSRHDFAARRPITMLTAFTMLFSGGMIPTFLVVKNLGLIDTVWSLVLPGLVSPWNMFIMKNYFQTSIPTELYEAASIDGADNFHLLRSVVLPLSAPIVAVMVLYYGVAHWNSYFNALLYLRDRTRYPLQLVLRSFFSANDYSEQGGAGGDSGMTALLVSETMKYALIVIASGPILCLYPLLQRFFVKGVMLGAIKG